MNIVLKKEAKQFLEQKRIYIRYLLIDGTLDKPPSGPCGCCGPPPSPDYKVFIFRVGEQEDPHDGPLVEVQKIVPIKIDEQLHDAINAAKMSIVLFFMQDVGASENEGTLVAKII